MKQIFGFNSAATMNVGVTNYANILSGISDYYISEHSLEAPQAIPSLILRRATFNKLRLGITAPGDGKSRIFTLRQNGADVGDPLTIADAETSAVNNALGITLEEDDTFGVKMVPVNTPAASTRTVVTYELETLGNRHAQYFSSAHTIDNSTTPRYHGVFSNNQHSSFWTTNIEEAYDICCIPGEIRGYGMNFRNWNEFLAQRGVLVIIKNGVVQDGSGGTVDTRVIWNVAPSQYIAFKNVDFVLTYEVGDILVVRNTAELAPFGGTLTGAMTVLARSEVAGESILAINPQSLNTSPGVYPAYRSTNESGTISGSFFEWQSNEAIAQCMGISTSFQLGKLIIQPATTFGAGLTKTVSVRKNEETSLLSVTAIGDDLNYDRDIVNAVTVEEGDEWNYIMELSGGFTSVLLRISIAQMIEVSPESSTGLGVVTPGQFHDLYNGGLALRIPTPFFKTGFIGS